MSEASAPGGARPAWIRMIPNALTLLRLLALPVLVVILARAEGPTSVTAGLLFGAVAATDWLDGILARRLGAESAFGRIADPLADRLLMAVALVGLILLERVHWSAPALLLARDVTLMAGFLLLARRGVTMRVDMAGKTSSALAMFGAGGCLLFAGPWVEVILWAAVALGLATLVNYARIASRALRRVSTSS